MPAAQKVEAPFLRRIPQKYSAAYRNYYTLQNLFAVRTCSWVFLALCVIIRVLYMLFPASLTKAENFPEFDMTNWLYILTSPIFVVASYLLISYFRKTKKFSGLVALFVFLFSIYLVTCGIFSSLIATSDPSNAVTLYMIPLVIIGVVCVFEFIETIILLITIAIIFTAFLLYAQAGPTEMVYNELISCILLAGFYLTSRYFYSFKANYYRQYLEIREKNVEIENAANFKNQVLGMVAHDLRNPLAAVESTALLMEFDVRDRDTQENIEVIKSSCVKARGIITDLLEAARNDDQNTVETVQIDLNYFVRKIIDSWKIHNEANARIIFTPYPHPLNVNVNKEKFHRVMDNLISNAIKFSKENENIEISLNCEQDFATIWVRDYGIGIPKDLLPALFDRFTKSGRAGIHGEQSTGLGLSIVKQIIERHKGRIEVDSVENMGSTFKISLPEAN
jgi:two-component system, OmpR family, sensor histidine kinase VicK